VSFLNSHVRVLTQGTFLSARNFKNLIYVFHFIQTILLLVANMLTAAAAGCSTCHAKCNQFQKYT